MVVLSMFLCMVVGGRGEGEGGGKDESEGDGEGLHLECVGERQELRRCKKVFSVGPSSYYLSR